jgi:hypothetical protein
MVVTDCLGIVNALHGSPQEACGPKQALARTWTLISGLLDGTFAIARERTRWMPSHTSAVAASSFRDSNGDPVTTIMWRANHLVDAAAKLAANEYRVPRWVMRYFSDAAAAMQYSAAHLGAATYAANNHVAQVWVDGGVQVKRTFRDSTAVPKHSAKRFRATNAERDRRAVASASMADSMPVSTAPKRPTCSHWRPANRKARRIEYATTERLRIAADNETRVANWLERRPPTRPPPVAAHDRTAALLARVRLRTPPSQVPPAPVAAPSHIEAPAPQAPPRVIDPARLSALHADAASAVRDLFGPRPSPPPMASDAPT